METMKNWLVKLIAAGKLLAEVKIQRGIYQDDALSPPNYMFRKFTGGRVTKNLQNHKKRLIILFKLMISSCLLK